MVRKLALVLALSMLASCGAKVRYFRVVFKQGPQLPDTCFEAEAMAAPKTPQEQEAEGFCRVGKKPTQSGRTTENLVLEESWTLIETGDGGFELIRGASGARTGIEGKKDGSKYHFAGKTSDFTSQCTGGGAGGNAQFLACAGVCVNLVSDRQNCGGCGTLCDGVCENGQCRPSCSSFPQTCKGVAINAANDDNNCGGCGNICKDGTVCSTGQCGPPCALRCTDSRYDAAKCSEARRFTKDVSTVVDFELSGSDLTGTATQGTAFGCSSSSCAPDFGSRCPACSQPSPILGQESKDVQEFEVR